ncbi:MAG: hypothetical protein ACK4N5_01575 [Myxococcales bacterium]
MRVVSVVVLTALTGCAGPLDAGQEPAGAAPLHVTESGRIGIGTLTPREQVEVVGRVRIDGDLEVTGRKHFVADNPHDKTQAIYYTALEGAETGTYTRGKVHLAHGKAKVNLPRHFGLVTSEDDLTVQLTASAGCAGPVTVARLSTEVLEIQEKGEKSDCDVYYLVQGVRKGFEKYEPIRKRGSK